VARKFLENIFGRLIQGSQACREWVNCSFFIGLMPIMLTEMVEFLFVVGAGFPRPIT
jgi:hypothetical protein